MKLPPSRASNQVTVVSWIHRNDLQKKIVQLMLVILTSFLVFPHYIYIYTDIYIYIYWSLLKAWLFGRCAWCPWCLWRKNVIKKEPRLGILRPKVSNWAAGQFVDVLDGGSRIARQRKTIKPFDGQWNSVDCTINDVVLGVPFNLELMWIN